MDRTVAWISATKAAKRLACRREAIKRLAADGVIGQRQGIGNIQARYNASDVDILAAKLFRQVEHVSTVS